MLIGVCIKAKWMPAHRAPKHSCKKLRPCQSGWHKKGAKMHRDAPRCRKSISSVYIVSIYCLCTLYFRYLPNFSKLFCFKFLQQLGAAWCNELATLRCCGCFGHGSRWSDWSGVSLFPLSLENPNAAACSAWSSSNKEAASAGWFSVANKDIKDWTEAMLNHSE